MTEINVKVEIEQLIKEQTQLQQQLQALDAQRNTLIQEILKRQGAIELLQRLDGRKDEEGKEKSR